MKKDYMEACMNSTRQRILQTIMIKKEATPAEIGEALPDIPRSTLYRHIKVLLDAEVIAVVRETVKRGTKEMTYAIAAERPYGDKNEDYDLMIQSALMGLQAEFHRYFQNEEADARKDLLTFASASVMMSDEEMNEFIMAYGALLGKYLENKPGEGRKLRKISFISSPGE